MSFHSFEPRNYLRTDPEKEYMKKILEMPQTHQKYITLIYELIKKKQFVFVLSGLISFARDFFKSVEENNREIINGSYFIKTTLKQINIQILL